MNADLAARLAESGRRYKAWLADPANQDQTVLTDHPGLVLFGIDPHPNMHGQMTPGGWWVRDLRGRNIGFYMPAWEGGRAHAVHWRTARGDVVLPATLEALLERCATDRRVAKLSPAP